MSHQVHIRTRLKTQSENRTDTIERTYTGRLSKTVEGFVIDYADSENNGNASLTIHEELVTVCRKGHINSELRFAKGKKLSATYHTPQGSLDMHTHTQSVNFRSRGRYSRITIDYALLIGSEEASSNSLTIDGHFLE